MKTLYTWDQIKQSKVLSSEREKEIELAVADRIKPIFYDNGQKIEGVLAYSLGTGANQKNYVFNEHHESFKGYLFREIMQDFLTDEEIELINSRVGRKIQEQEEVKRFDKAAKVSASEWSEGAFYNGHLYWNIDDAKDAIEEESLDRGDEFEFPSYLWATERKQVIPPIDVADIVERFIEDNGWEDMDVGDLKGVKELQEALDRFTEANKDVVSYWESNKVAIVL